MQKLIVIGFDGLEQTLLQRYWDEGRCQHLRRLRDRGGFRLLGTTTPAESPVAWSSFVTGTNPGVHRIFDFLHRDPRTYQPVLSLAETRAPARSLEFLHWKLPVGRVKTSCGRAGRPFWHSVAAAGHPVTVVRVPVTYPPEPFAGRLLCSMGVPDLHGTQGTYQYWTTDSSLAGPGRGGDATLISFDEDRCTAALRPMQDAFRRDARAVSVAVQLRKHRGGLQLAVGGRQLTLKPAEWSPWTRVVYRLSLGAKAVGWVRFLLVSLDPHVSLYCSPVNLDPRTTRGSLSHPPGYAAELQGAIGPYATLGMAEDTWVLNERRMDEAAFLASCQDVLAERERMLDFELQRLRSGLLICVFDQPDRIQHMFWRVEDPQHPAHDEALRRQFGTVLADLYERLDGIVGKIRAAHPDANLIVMSDHGCKPFRRAFHVNTWLYRNGHLALHAAQGSGRHSNDALYFQNADLERSQAYALGLSGIYLNLRGRERQGRVTLGAMADRVKRQIVSGLTDLRDPDNGMPVVRRVMQREEIFRGAAVADAPDLIVCYHAGYRASWQTALGGVPAAMIEDNLHAWSGDHCIDPDLVPGVVLSDLPLSEDPIHIMDIAPSVHRYFQVPPDTNHEGRPMWAAAAT